MFVAMLFLPLSRLMYDCKLSASETAATGPVEIILIAGKRVTAYLIAKAQVSPVTSN